MPGHWFSLPHGWCEAVAGGIMLGAAFGLFAEAGENKLGTFLALIGAGIGVASIALISKWLSKQEEFVAEYTSNPTAHKALFFFAIMAVHTFAEGVGVGVSFGSRPEKGESMAVAIGVHNIPEGLAVASVAVSHGQSVLTAMAVATAAAFPQAIMAVPAYLFVDFFSQILPIGLGFAAGAMMWLVLSEMVTEASESLGKKTAATTVLLGFLAMTTFEAIFSS
mmetsp:Transcript_47784/g.123967  ORF Transcript_47784/g.123967 Transcript_47784/m.123967 type:complete len:222 (+) Transcript_47784:323-988(+)